VRYADDAVLLFTDERDARRVFEALPRRCSKYGLALHEGKTRLVRFLSPARDSGGQRPGSFEFLGFLHHWGRSRKGRWVVKKRTAKGRFTAALKRIWQWCRQSRHLPIPEQQETLAAKLRGHYAYYGLKGNYLALGRFLHEVKRAWQYWLNRRSWAGRRTWDWFHRLLRRHPLPPPRVAKPAPA
jgi:hypothetical protein